MKWPFFRRRASSAPGDERGSRLGVEEWLRLPSIESILSPLEEPHAITEFVEGLATRRPLPVSLGRLEHLVSETAPSGVISALSLVRAKRPRRLGRPPEASRRPRRDAPSIEPFSTALEEPPVEGPPPSGRTAEAVPAARRMPQRESLAARAISPAIRSIGESARESMPPAFGPETIDAPALIRRSPADAGPVEAEPVQESERDVVKAAEAELQLPADRLESVEPRGVSEVTAPQSPAGAPERATSVRDVLAESAARAVPSRLQSALPAAPTLGAVETAARNEIDEVTPPPRFRLTAIAGRLAEPLASSVVSPLRPARGAVGAEPMPVPAIPASPPAAHPFPAPAAAPPEAALHILSPSAPPTGASAPAALLPPTPTAAAPPAATAEPVAPPAVLADAAPATIVEPSPPDLETLADDLYEHLRARLTQELVLDRERTLFTPDLG
jgi:hypothetical protein